MTAKNTDIHMNTHELRATWGLGLVFSLRMLGMFMVLPVLTTYGMALQGASETLIGIAIGIYGLMQALLQIPFGLWSDRLGRKPLIVGGLVVFTLGSVIAAMTHSIWGVILGRALQGSGAIAAAVMALLSDLTREQNRTKAMAFIGISFGITFAIAMVTGPVITHYIGLNGLFWVIAALAASAILLTLFFVPDSNSHTLNRDSGIVRGSFQKVIHNSRLVKLNLGIFCMHFLLMSTFIALPLQLKQTSLPDSEYWKIYLFTMLAAFICVLPPIIYAEAKRKMRLVFTSCIGLLILAQGILWWAEANLYSLIVGVLIFFIAFNLMEALLPSLVSKEAPAGFRGTAMGVYSTSQFLGVACGGSIGGWLAGHLGAPLVFLAGAGLAFLWFLLSLTMQEPPYLSSLRLTLPANAIWPDNLQPILLQQNGVHEVLIVPQENSIYIKIDNKITNRQKLEQLLDQLLQ
ncbi:MFS transporter [Neisseriaceae bacterium ESL0693]|nr:MFS transporter [Neisseriaceae bacterium ESL0693]